MTITIAQLVAAVGSANIKLQTLHSSTVGANASKDGTKITFLTDQMTPGDFIASMAGTKPENAGLVLWMKQTELDQAMDALRQRNDNLSAKLLQMARDAATAGFYISGEGFNAEHGGPDETEFQERTDDKLRALVHDLMEKL